MRSIKLVPVLAAMAMLFALAPAGASAAKHPGLKRHKHALRIHAGSCRLNLNAAPRFIEAGESAVVFGTLLCPAGTSAANQAVTILQRSAGTPGVSTAGTATTDATGHYQLTTPALQTNSFFYATALGAQSGKRPVKVSPKVSLSGPADGSQLFTGAGPFIHSHALRFGLRNKVTFTGTVSPADAGAIVVLQRQNAIGGEEWRRIGLGQVGQGGTYAITHTFAVPGDANIRVVVRPRKLNSRGASESLSYEISQAQNPALTINSSADPISYGQPVTISGTIAAGAGTPLTLLARPRLQSKFSPVASTVSTTGGAYTFGVQTPLQSTFYQVTGAGKASARLFEGVKYGLTAAASASTVQAGQPLTFSGTVTPAHAGHAVYLQAQNASGIGFHVVEVGTVSAGSTYSITHTPFNTGAKKYRVKVPGDPENQGVASPLFGVEVTPAPASALIPEAPGNSTPPSEGHV
jgi:hypothetical protein